MKRFYQKTQQAPTNARQKYSVLSRNTAVLTVLFFIVISIGAFNWHYLAVSAIQNPSNVDMFGYDFSVYYRAGGDLRTSVDPYQPTSFNNTSMSGTYQLLPYVYPPPVTFLFVPFSFFTFEQARVLAMVIYVVTLVLSLFFIIKILHHYDVHLSKLAMLLIGVAVFAFDPIYLTFSALNINIVILFLLTVFYYLFFVKNKQASAGVVIAVACIIKVFPVILLLLGFLRKGSKMVGMTIASVLLLCLISLWLQGVGVYRGFIMNFLNLQNAFVTSRALILSPSSWGINISPTYTIVKLLVLLNVNVGYVLSILTITKFVFVASLFFYMFKVSKIGKDVAKSREWDALSFTLLLVALFFVSNVTEIYYTSFLVLSFVLLTFVVRLTLIEKAAFLVSLTFFATRIAVEDLFSHIGGLLKTVAYIIPPSTIGYTILFALTVGILWERTKNNYWSTPF